MTCGLIRRKHASIVCLTVFIGGCTEQGIIVASPQSPGWEMVVPSARFHADTRLVFPDRRTAEVPATDFSLGDGMAMIEEGAAPRGSVPLTITTRTPTGGYEFSQDGRKVLSVEGTGDSRQIEIYNALGSKVLETTITGDWRALINAGASMQQSGGGGYEGDDDPCFYGSTDPADDCGDDAYGCLSGWIELGVLVAAGSAAIAALTYATAEVDAAILAIEAGTGTAAMLELRLALENTAKSALRSAAGFVLGKVAAMAADGCFASHHTPGIQTWQNYFDNLA